MGFVPGAPEVRVFIYTDSLCNWTNIPEFAADPDDVQWKMALTLHLDTFGLRCTRKTYCRIQFRYGENIRTTWKF